MKNLIAFLTMCLVAAPVEAQDGTGSITGTLELDPARWVVAAGGDGPVSGYTRSGDGMEIRIVGTPEPESDGGPGTLMIEIDVATGAVEARATDVRIEFRRADGVLSAESENIDLTLEAFQEAGASLALAGSFFAVLTPEPQEGTVIDAENGVTIDGNFQATIPEQSGD